MKDFIFSILAYLGMLILWFIIFVGITIIGYFIFCKTINEANNVLYAFILGSASGVVAGYIMYIVAHLHLGR